MELYLQMGHGMQAMSQELIKHWGSGNVIISPMNFIDPCIESVQKLTDKIHAAGGDVLFDPQMFFPKDGHDKLKAYDYWPMSDVSVISETENESVNRELLRINNRIGSSQIILPGSQLKETQLLQGIKLIEESVEFFSKKTTKPLLATLCLYPETIRNSEGIENLVALLRSIPVDGFYIIPQPSSNEYIVSDELWVIGLMKLVTCLKLAKKRVVVGYSNHQGLIYSLAGADAIASGSWMNTRSFVPSKFKSQKDDDIKHRSTWYYLPTALSEYKATILDVAQQRGFLEAFASQGEFNNAYSSVLFKGAKPSSTNYNETSSFKHYLHCLRSQCDMLTKESYQETYDTYEFMLTNAETQIKEFKKRGISGQNRDFNPAIESNRLAMCTNDEEYGLKLQFDWK